MIKDVLQECYDLLESAQNKEGDYQYLASTYENVTNKVMDKLNDLINDMEGKCKQ